MESGLLTEINRARLNRNAVAVITDITSGQARLVFPEDVAHDPHAAEISTRLASGKSGLVETAAGDIFIQVYVPSPKIVVIGAVHISQAFYPMAQACGFDVTLIDPRSAFATEDRFASVELFADWPQEVLRDHKLDAYTALVALTHDPKIDDFPLSAGLNANCFYVGALGSRKTHAKRCERLALEGLSQSQIDRIHAPIGLNIGAVTPAEIAVAVLGEIIDALRQKPDNRLVGFVA